MVKEEWDRDPWFTAEQAAPKLGLIDHNAVKRYIRRGWLAAERKPGAGGLGVWIIRQSAIAKLLKNDPRREHRRLALVKSRHQASYRNHDPVALQKIWVIKCPVCRHKTTIKSNPNLAAPELKGLFLRLYTNGTCSHGKVCIIQEREVRPIGKRKGAGSQSAQEHGGEISAERARV